MRLLSVLSGLLLVCSTSTFGSKLQQPFSGPWLLNGQNAPSTTIGKMPFSAENITEEFFVTLVDHFNLQNRDTWSNRYLSLMDHFVPTGPILIFLAGSIPVNSALIDETTLINEMARELGGALFAFETRFYGESQPTVDLSVENLKLLNTDQILADLAEFVIHLRRNVIGNPFAHVLVAGTGLGGGLATWFRVRYPHLTDAAWSSSGYLNAIYDFQEFSSGWAETAVQIGGQECYNSIFVAFHVAQNLVEAGFERLMYDMFNICEPIDAEDRFDVAYFFSVLMTSIEVYTLRNGDVLEFERVCGYITKDEFGTPLEALADWFNKRFEEDNGCIIVDVHTSVEQFLTDDPDDEVNASGARLFLYQQCTEYGWFFTTDSDLQPFGERVQMELYYELCRLIFGEWITTESMYRGVVRTNDLFGGNSPVVQQVHFTNGALDPWRYASVLYPLNSYALADVIPWQLAGADLRATSVENDSQELLEVKTRLKELFESYLFPANPRK
ncbi:putative serine protease K12H4.7 [Anopheles darlingi]|uniref:putative serine protease K12H4.7 n=1 Tax=Anopheles darlingi TaxID=43151 RepID=UPI0021005D4C|nr:putative serine protease K12H4.7 [Anopheles darlingi]